MTTINTRQLQQYTKPTNNNYTQDNLKLATIHTRQIAIRQTMWWWQRWLWWLLLQNCI